VSRLPTPALPVATAIPMLIYLTGAAAVVLIVPLANWLARGTAPHRRRTRR